MDPQAELRGEIERITYRNDDNGWTVMRLRHEVDPELITVTGSFSQIHAGEFFQLFGKWTSHPQYGRQFKAERAVPIRPNTREGIQKYLASGVVKGIGEKTAAKIIKHFGTETLSVLDHNPERLLEVTSIGRKKAQLIVKEWQAKKAQRDIELFLNMHGFKPSQVAKIIKAYGDTTISEVSKSPYRLADEIHGIGFLTADKIALHLGIAVDSADRIAAGTLYCLSQSEERGHCFLTTPQLLQDLSQLLRVPTETLGGKLADTLSQLNLDGKIISEREEREGLVHYRSEILVAETNVADKISSMLRLPVIVEDERIDRWLTRYNEQLSMPLSESQCLAVKRAAHSRVFVLTGGPGVGKTTTANTIIRLFKAMGKSVALAAPTGRAAQRLSEVSATEARTIHRLLEWSPQIQGFSRDSFNPILAQVIIIDEASMLDIRLAESLLEAVEPSTQLIFIGDVDQLPSVGPGNFLRDLIASDKVPVARLTEIFRQAATSRIIQTAHAINSGITPVFDNDSQTDCRFIEVETPEGIRGVIKDLLRDVLPRGKRFHALTDVQILTPMNRGDLGTQLLNQELQELLNPKLKDMHEYKRGDLSLRPGDKVIQVANNYDLGVFNGDIGFVQHAGVNDQQLIVTFGDKKVTYDQETVTDLKLAYAITIHKSQGSEFPVVIIPISSQHHIMLQRNLIYTALTRAKKMAYFVGTPRSLKYAINNHLSLQRQTRLAPRIQEQLPS